MSMKIFISGTQSCTEPVGKVSAFKVFLIIIILASF